MGSSNVQLKPKTSGLDRNRLFTLDAMSTAAQVRVHH